MAGFQELADMMQGAAAAFCLQSPQTVDLWQAPFRCSVWLRFALVDSRYSTLRLDLQRYNEAVQRAYQRSLRVCVSCLSRLISLAAIELNVERFLFGHSVWPRGFPVGFH